MRFMINFAPELYQFILICAIYAVSVINKQSSNRWIAWASFAGVLAALGSLSREGMFLFDAYKIDALSQFFKLVIAAGFFIVALNGKRLSTVDADKRIDYFLLLAISAWGLMMLCSAVEMMTMVICLEISSYSLYALVPIRAGSKEAAESGVKYILFGAAASAFALMGYSLVLASVHSSYINWLGGALSMSNPMGLFGITLFLSAFFYKLALFPFHFWCPDVYTGTGNETAAFIATLPKVGAMAALIRLVHAASPNISLTDTLAILAAISITFGNIAALVQSDVKRLLGYSSIAHAGYILIGLIAGTAAGLAASAFYAMAYMVMNLTCFWVICRMAPNGDNVSLDDLSGLHQRAPWLAFVLAVGAFALVGLPPTVGFTGKLFLLTSAWGKGYDWLIIVAAVNTAFSIFYYLNLVRYAYTADTVCNKEIDLSVGAGSVAMILACIVLLLGSLPAFVYDLAFAAGKQFLP
jgi:NADH-quinone oxidoreductase subunit N